MTHRRSVVPEAPADGRPTDTDVDRPALDGAASTPTPPDAAPDPFDPASLRLSPDAAAGLGVKKALLTVPVRKPDRSWWVRTHADPDYRLETAVIELKEDRETYLVAPALRPELATESTLSPRALVTTINRQGVLFLWPIKLPGADGRLDEWSRSALDAADRAATGWVRVQASMALGAYEVWQTTAPTPDPEWPATSFRDLLRIAFRDRLIDSLDHPVLRKLRGEA
jgi:hypothetical protein